MNKKSKQKQVFLKKWFTGIEVKSYISIYYLETFIDESIHISNIFFYISCQQKYLLFAKREKKCTTYFSLTIWHAQSVSHYYYFIMKSFWLESQPLTDNFDHNTEPTLQVLYHFYSG